MSDPVERPVPDQSEKVQLPVKVFQQMDVLDENQILAEMKGELLEDFVYSAEIQGKQVTNLSYAGVKEAVRRRGKYEILDVHVEEDKDQFRALIKVRDLIRQVDMLGASACEKSKPFAYTLALNKAERNAYSKLLPAKLLAGMIKEFLERRKARPISIPSTGISQGTESPVPEKQSPTNQEEKPAEILQDRSESGLGKTAEATVWKVPITTDPVEGVERQVLKKEDLAVGVANYLHNESAFVPARPFPSSDPALPWLAKILEAKKARHQGFEYVLRKEDQMLKAVLTRAPDVTMIRDLEAPCAWTFYTALTRPDRSHVGGPLGR